MGLRITIGLMLAIISASDENLSLSTQIILSIISAGLIIWGSDTLSKYNRIGDQ